MLGRRLKLAYRESTEWMFARTLAEGLQVGDLKNLVQPLISIDEYESKLGDDSQIIVVAFFVDDQDPASDLSRFIEKGDIPVLDSEVSPAPNEDGLYLVFVEVPREPEFPKLLMRLVASISGLTGEMPWRFKPYGHKTVEKLTADNLKKHVELDRNVIIRREKEKEAEEARKAEAKRKAKEAEKAKLEKAKAEQQAKAKAEQDKAKSDATPPAKDGEAAPADAPPEPAEDAAPTPPTDEPPADAPPEPPAADAEPEATPKAKPKTKAKKEHAEPSAATRLFEFFRPSLLDDLSITPGTGTLVLGNRREGWEFRPVAFGRLDRLMERAEFTDVPFDLSAEGLAASRRLARRLGPGWDVQRTKTGFVLANGSYGLVLADE